MKDPILDALDERVRAIVREEIEAAKVKLAGSDVYTSERLPPGVPTRDCFARRCRDDRSRLDASDVDGLAHARLGTPTSRSVRCRGGARDRRGPRSRGPSDVVALAERVLARTHATRDG